ncbi:hypothetical protein D9619_001361 [Psilocybe cf. subviscida]|uniref:YCII-related domain-containing protein n=1 Tax=Psilocybe cf. subviscida TaxID=2480587 RepID=A0A8H5BG82_9AGAR|nr:hypothetical protein D9619_001361 [Psilocybe cf. subviscida]
MSAASTADCAPKKHLFMVYAPDKTEEGTLARRLAVREQHLAASKPRHESGLTRVGGMFTTPEGVTSPDAPKHMLGSLMIYEAESIEQVKEIIENDIYYTSGVWDPARMVIAPFFTGHPI